MSRQAAGFLAGLAAFAIPGIGPAVGTGMWISTLGGAVLGIVSMNDIVLAAGARKPVRDSEVVETLQAVCAHHHPAPHVVAA